MWIAINLGDITKASGPVKWVNTPKSVGFIAPECGSNDIFAHISAPERAGVHQLDDGQDVTFDIESGRGGRETVANLALA